MSILVRKHFQILSKFSGYFRYIGLAQKALVLLYRSKSWTILGIRIINRLSSNRKKVSFALAFFFPKSAAWFEVKVATETKSIEEMLKAIKHLVGYKKIYYEYCLIEFNFDMLLKSVEDRDQYSFKYLYQKKINEYLKDSALYEIHNSFFLKKIPRINFHIDDKRFVFLLPIQYLFKNNSHKKKLENFKHSFSLPSQIGQKNDKRHEVEIDGDRIWELNNVKLIRGYQVIGDEGYLCYERAADPINKFIAGYADASPTYRVLDGIPYSKVNIVNFNFQYLNDIFLVSGRCTVNYFHWLIEYMPKLLWLARDSGVDLKQLAIAVDNRMPNQHYQSLNYFLNKIKVANPIIKINPDQNIYNIKKLIIASNPTYMPDSIEQFSYPDCSGINLKTLSEYRNIMLTDVKTDQKRKIYIARSNNNNRKLVNELEIIALCVSYGFEIVYPEKFSFEEQLKLFNSAKYIIGPAGAAFSNLIFCQKGTVVINFLAEENKEASIFSNLCTLSESSYYLETGKLLKERMFFSDTISWLYSNYKVDIQALDERLKSIVIEQ